MYATSNHTSLKSVTPSHPCTICGGTHKCSRGSDGLIICGRRQGPVPGFRYLGQAAKDDQFALYRFDDRPPARPSLGTQPGPSPAYWEYRAGEDKKLLTEERCGELAGILGLPQWVLAELPIGYDPDDRQGPCWTFPECNGAGRFIGVVRRYRDGRKQAVGGSRRGLTIPVHWRDHSGVLFCPEGPSDVLALTALGQAAVGRPSNTGGVTDLAAWLRPQSPERKVIVLGENDPKPDGAWPGREGAVKTAQTLSAALGRPIFWALPPESAKDVRDWVRRRNPDPAIADAWHDLGDEFARLMAADGVATPVTGMTETEAGPATDADSAVELVSIEPEPWEPPVPLCELPTVLPFPTDVLPASLQKYVAGVQTALACPADFVGVPLLVLAGAAIGAGRVIEIKPGWRERPCLFAVTVGPPGTAKSPALKEVCTPLYERQHALKGRYDQEHAAYEEAMARYQPPEPSDPTPDILAELGLVDRLNAANSSSAKPVTPTLRSLYVDDATVESLGPLLHANPEGLVLIRDESAALMTGFNQYKSGKGNDKQFFLKVWAGDPIKVDRKGQKTGPILVMNPFLAILGGLPPDLLNFFQGPRGASDGFLDRFLFAYPDQGPLPHFQWTGLAAPAAALWSHTIDLLHGLATEKTGAARAQPHVVGLTECGRVAFEKVINCLVDEMNAPDVPRQLWGPWSKLRGYCARLALIVHCLRWVHGEATGEEVDGESVDRAARLIAYFASHGRKVHTALDIDYSAADARHVLQWIRRNRKTCFTRRQALHDLRRTFHTVELLKQPLQTLVQHGYIRPLPRAIAGAVGRPLIPLFEVSPFVMEQDDQKSESG
jgi:hypothetical protein